jgi:hypothetical protein
VSRRERGWRCRGCGQEAQTLICESVVAWWLPLAIDVCPLCGPSTLRAPSDPPLTVGVEGPARHDTTARLLLHTAAPAARLAAPGKLFVVGREGAVHAAADFTLAGPVTAVEVTLPAGDGADTVRISGVLCRDLALQIIRARIVVVS